MFVTTTLVALLLQSVAGSKAVQPPASSTLVMPFESADEGSKLYWLGEGSAVLLSDLLERYGAALVPRHERLQAFEQLQLPPSAALSHATTIKIGQFVGATEVVIGSFSMSGDVLTVRVRAIQPALGRITSDVSERGPLTDLFGIFDRAARRLRGATAAAPPPPPGTVLSSHYAFELYVKGLIAASPATQQGFLEQAAKSAPADDRVKLALWQVYSDAGRHERALDVAATVPASSLQSHSARYLVARSQLELKRYDEAFNTLKALQSVVRSADVLNAIGVVQLRRGATAPSGRAVYFFSQASQLDPSDGDLFFNLGYGYWIDKDPPAAMYWMREAVRRNPTDGEAHLVLAAALQQTGAATEAARERELAERLGATFSRASADAVPRGLERLADHLDRSTRRLDSVLTSAGQRDQIELALFHLDNGRRAFEREADREAEQELRRALYLSPYLSEAQLLLGRVQLRNGRTSEAIQAFKIALWSEDTAKGHAALAEAYATAHNMAAAKEELDRALKIDPHSPEAKLLRAKIFP
jgi:tetratricopeptide (TPR) repeat protein